MEKSWKELINNILSICKKASRAEITVYAAQASFFIIIAAFPFIMLLLTLLQFIPNINQSDLLRLLTQIMPDTVHSIVVSVINDLYIKSPGTILSVTAVSALWSASIGIMGIVRGLNRIYRCTSRGNYIMQRIVGTVYTALFVFACVAALIVLVLGSSIRGIVLRSFPFFVQQPNSNLNRLTGIFAVVLSILTMGKVLSSVLLFVCFIGIYTFLPAKKQNPVKQVPGALFSTLGWVIFSCLFSLYFKYFGNFSYMYGSLTAIVLLMLWLYFCICIIFFGALINQHLQKQ